MRRCVSAGEGVEQGAPAIAVENNINSKRKYFGLFPVPPVLYILFTVSPYLFVIQSDYSNKRTPRWKHVKRNKQK
jgi:hypothetical protein